LSHFRGKEVIVILANILYWSHYLFEFTHLHLFYLSYSFSSCFSSFFSFFKILLDLQAFHWLLFLGFAKEVPHLEIVHLDIYYDDISYPKVMFFLQYVFLYVLILSVISNQIFLKLDQSYLITIDI
jgi:hypothetical protein